MLLKQVEVNNKDQKKKLKNQNLEEKELKDLTMKVRLMSKILKAQMINPKWKDQKKNLKRNQRRAENDR